MSNTQTRLALRIVLGFATIGCCLFLSDDLRFSGPKGPLVKQAQAYIGNPLTPMSYAGVARRTARRTERREYYYGSGAPYGYGAPPPAYGSPYGYPPPPYGYAPPPY
jgi:hypothetical protein